MEPFMAKMSSNFLEVNLTCSDCACSVNQPDMIVADEPTGSWILNPRNCIRVFTKVWPSGEKAVLVRLLSLSSWICGCNYQKWRMVRSRWRSPKNKGLSFKNKFKLSLSNFMENGETCWLVTTSISFVGVLISFWSRDTLISMIDENTNE